MATKKNTDTQPETMATTEPVVMDERNMELPEGQEIEQANEVQPEKKASAKKSKKIDAPVLEAEDFPKEEDASLESETEKGTSESEVSDAALDGISSDMLNAVYDETETENMPELPAEVAESAEQAVAASPSPAESVSLDKKEYDEQDATMRELKWRTYRAERYADGRRIAEEQLPSGSSYETEEYAQLLYESKATHIVLHGTLARAQYVSSKRIYNSESRLYKDIPCIGFFW